MNWIEVCIHTTNEAIEPVSNILNEKGSNGVVIVNSLDLEKDRETPLGEVFELPPENYPKEGVYIKTYLPDNEDYHAYIEEVRQAIEKLRDDDIEIGKNEITISNVKEEDWSTAWKKYYKPVQVTDKITIIPSWEDYETKTDDELIIELDPGMAFGTGTHATTKLSLQDLEQVVRPEDVVIDVGCGSGVLSIASVKLGAKKVYAYDLDAVAVKSTTLNADLNQVDKSIMVQKNNLLENVSLQADVIVSNILAEVILRFISDAWSNLKDDGLFLISGIIKRKEELIKKELINVGFTISKVQHLDGWVSIIAQKKA